MTEVIVSWSEINTYRQCPHKHLLSYKERWTRQTKSPALVRGTLWHEVLAHHYAGLMNRKMKAAKAAITQLLGLDLPDEQRTEQQILVEWMYQGYLQQYKTDPEWKVLGIEYTELVPFPWRSSHHDLIDVTFILKVKIDLITRWSKWAWIVDHKSGKDLPNKKELDLDDQFALYQWAMQQLGFDIHGTIYNAARTQRNKSKAQPLDERFKRVPLDRSRSELEVIAHEAFLTVERAYSDQLAGRTPDTEMCRFRCDYSDACIAGRKGIDERLLLKGQGFVQDFTRH